MMAKLTFCDCCGQEFYDIYNHQTCDDCLDLISPDYQILFGARDSDKEVEIDWDNIPF